MTTKSQGKVLKLVVDAPAPARRKAEGAEPKEGKVRERTALKARKIQLDGLEELTLQCGKASITLRKDGRVVIRGTYVETRSSGTNRIKGSVVKLN